MLAMSTQSLGRETHFRLAGRLVAGSTETLLSSIRTHPVPRVLDLELSNVPSADAAGLGFLVALLNWTREAGATLTFTNVSSSVERLLVITHLRDLFDLRSARMDNDDAVRSNITEGMLPYAHPNWRCCEHRYAAISRSS